MYISGIAFVDFTQEIDPNLPTDERLSRLYAAALEVNFYLHLSSSSETEVFLFLTNACFVHFVQLLFFIPVQSRKSLSRIGGV